MSTGLALLLLTAYSVFNVVVARTCESDDGQSSIECDDSDICCETNGDLDCCTAEELWYVWLIIGVVILSIAAIPIIACCCGYYFYKKYGCICPQNSFGGGYGGGNVGYCSGNVGGGSCPGAGSH